MKATVWIMCVSVHMCVVRTESTHIHLLRCVDEYGHPVTYVQHHADHWDETQKPDILHHAGPLRQLYSLNLENAKLGHGSEEKRQPDVWFVCVCVHVSGGGGKTDKRGVAGFE